VSEVNFSLTKKNFRLLIEHVFIGNWVLNAAKVDREKSVDEFYNTILSIGKNYNLVEGIVYDEDHDEYELGEEKEKEIISKIEEYDDTTFWEELVSKLATRDAITKYGSNELCEMDQIERMKIIWDEEEKYNKEFEKNGIENLRLKRNKN